MAEFDEVLARGAELEISALGCGHLAGGGGLVDGEAGGRKSLGELVDGDVEGGEVLGLRGLEVLCVGAAEFNGASPRRRSRLGREVEGRRCGHGFYR